VAVAGLWSPSPKSSSATLRPSRKSLTAIPPFFDSFLDVSSGNSCKSGHREHEQRTDLLDVLRYILEGLDGIFARLDRCHAGADLHADVDAGGVGEGVVPGEDEEQDEVFWNRELGKALLEVCRIVPVRQDDALGVGGRARRISRSSQGPIPSPPATGDHLFTPAFEELLPRSRMSRKYTKSPEMLPSLSR